MKPFRFGVQLRRTADAADFIRVVKSAEHLGYDVITMADHFDDTFAPVPALMMAAAVTQKVRIGGLVFCNDYKHPVVLARELATLDVLSGGRTQIGLGAGWMKSDYEAAGLAYDEPRVRLDRFEEGLRIIKALLSQDDAVSFEGKHYRIKDLKGAPRPLQRPHPPLFIGGGGQRMLSIAAREADVVGINVDLRRGQIDQETLKQLTHDLTAERVGWVKAAAGSRFDQIELGMSAFVVSVTDHRQRVAEKIAEEQKVPVEALLAMPNAFIGASEDIVRQLEVQRERYGFTHITVMQHHMEEFSEVVKLAHDRTRVAR